MKRSKLSINCDAPNGDDIQLVSQFHAKLMADWILPLKSLRSIINQRRWCY